MTAETSRLLITLGLFGLTAVSIAVGVQVVLILIEFRKSMRKVNKILDDAGVVSESVAKPAAAISGLVTGIKEGSSLIKKFVGKS